MQLIMRLLMILAAVLVTAQPVMACPLMLQAATQNSISETAEHPCHEMIAGQHTRSTPDSQSQSDCPAGDDCSPMLMQAQVDATPTATAAEPAQVFAAILAEPPVAFPPERSVYKTGPPPPPDLPLFTPVTLKQRLLN